MKSFKYWQKSEINFLRQNYNRLNCTQLGTKLGRSKSSVVGQLHKLGLLRSPEARARMKSATCFKKGHVPFNKGRSFRASPATEFKPGHRPANTKFNGCIVIRVHKRTQTPYKYIRVAKMRWQLYHRHVWEKKHGPIPSGHVVRFKNRNTLDCRPSNLFLLSRGENARRNYNSAKAGETMRRNWENGRHLQSDNYIAFTLSPKNMPFREIAKHNPALLEMQRLKLKLRRAIHVRTDQKA